MSSKVKSNILYIASDDSSEENSNQKVTDMEKQRKNLAKNAFALSGSHRLNNNVISRGYFIPQASENDYQYQNPKPAQELQSLSQSVKLNPRNSRKSQQGSPKFVRLATESIINEIQQEKKVEELQRVQPKTKAVRSKTLMFQFEQSDNQITKPLQQVEKIKKQIQEVIEKQSHPSPKQIETSSESPKHRQPTSYQDAQTVCITPQYMKSKLDKKQFLLLPIPRNHTLEARVIKKNEITNFLYSQFDMTFRNYLVHVASCKKMIANIGSNYRISTTDEEFSYLKKQVVGKVRSKDTKEVYNVYNDGINPEENDQKNADIRKIMATVRIKTKKGPRELEVFLLKPGATYQNLLGTNLHKEMNLETLYSIEENRKHIQVLRTRKPLWVPERGEYFLNFRGLIKQPSIRNFILEDATTSEQILLFGKCFNNNYNINISYPLSPMLGLALVIPQLDRDD